MIRHADWDAEAARALIDRLQHLEGAVLPILHALQHEFGYIHNEAATLIADALNLSRAEVHGTISFYHDFLSKPDGARTVQVCRAEACQAVGCEDMLDLLRRDHGIEIDKTTPDGRLTLRTVYCLGNCALGPAAMVDGELVGMLDGPRLARLCEAGGTAEARPETVR